jgi:hypothetical protein
MHAFRAHVPSPGRSTRVGLRSLARVCGMERKRAGGKTSGTLRYASGTAS